MNKLYWIVCEERDKTLYEGRFLGRTRGAALKHLKEQIGRSNLTGLIFSITEIPVPLIREIIEQVLAGNAESMPLSETRPPAPAEPEKIVRYEAFNEATKTEAEAKAKTEEPSKAGYDWPAIKNCYMEGRGPKDVAEMMDVPINTLKKRITRAIVLQL